MTELKVYGAPWCPDCRRSKKFPAEHSVPYDWIDIDRDPLACASSKSSSTAAARSRLSSAGHLS